MPYITETTRKPIDEHLDGLDIATEGELNYAITKLCFIHLSTYQPITYSDFNSVIGALECAKMELYRRQIAAYEDEKIKENGEIVDWFIHNGKFNLEKE